MRGWRSNRPSRKDDCLNVTFFAGSVVGYVDNPSAILTRGLAYGLALRGNDVRVVEERQNRAFGRTLRAVGSGPSRHFYDHFSMIQHTTYEPRTGAQLLEFVTREVALVNAVVVVSDVNDETCRWLANVTRERLTRCYLTWEPDALTPERARTLELQRFDLIFAPSQPGADLLWLPVDPVVAIPDRDVAMSVGIIADGDPLVVASAFERALAHG